MKYLVGTAQNHESPCTPLHLKQTKFQKMIMNIHFPQQKEIKNPKLRTEKDGGDERAKEVERDVVEQRSSIVSLI